MTKLYKKSPLVFALVWIGAYIVLLSLADSVSKAAGVPNSAEAVVAVCLTVIAAAWIFSQGLSKKFGLCRINGSLRPYLWFVPMIAIVSTNLWRGINMDVTVTEVTLHIVLMACVGFLEEIIFRGFLFTAMVKDGVKSAVIVSSLTFGVGHISNLLQGADFGLTMLQICYAVAAGFLFTIIFLRSGSLWPCIVTHGVLNSLSVFANNAGRTFFEAAMAALFLCVVPSVYAWWILKHTEASH